MSIETHVFFSGSLPTPAELEQAMQELGFPFTIDKEVTSLEEQSGFMPMLRGKEETGVEFDVSDTEFDGEMWEEVGIDAQGKRVASFRSGSDFGELVAGMCGAAALAKLLGAVVYNDCEDWAMNPEEAVVKAKKCLKELEDGSYLVGRS